MTKNKELIDFTPKWLKYQKLNVSDLRGKEKIFEVKYENESLEFFLEISKNDTGVFFYLQRKWKEFTNQISPLNNYDVPDGLEINNNAKSDVRVWFVSYDFYNEFIGTIEDAYKQISNSLVEELEEDDLKEEYKIALYNYLSSRSNYYFSKFLNYKLLSDIFINKSFEQYKDAVVNVLEKEKNEIDTKKSILQYYTEEQSKWINDIDNLTKYLSKKTVTKEIIDVNGNKLDSEVIFVDEYPEIVKLFEQYKEIKLTKLENVKEYLRVFNLLKEAINEEHLKLHPKEKKIIKKKGKDNVKSN